MAEQSVGLLLGTFHPPERIPQAAEQGERLGFNELWLTEDYFYTGGISSLTAALGMTTRAPIGTGIVSGLVRHPAVLAMELATIERMHPGRVRPGIALGHLPWLRQMGVYPRSSLGAMSECMRALRGLLAGEEVTFDGDTFSLDRVKLTYPPADPLPIYMGGIAPKMLRLSGELADGNIVPLFASPTYLTWAREQIALGTSQEGLNSRALVVFVFFSVGSNRTQVRESIKALLAFCLAECLAAPALFEPNGMLEELRDLVQRGGVAAVERAMPEHWLDELAVVGEADECAEKIRRFFAAGATSVILYPVPPADAERMITLAATEVLPRI